MQFSRGGIHNVTHWPNMMTLLPSENRHCLVCHSRACPPGTSFPPRNAESIAVWPRHCTHGLWAPPSPMCVLWCQACLHQPVLGSWAGSAAPPKSQLDSSYFLTLNSSQHSLLAYQHPHSHGLMVLVLLRERQCFEVIKWHGINN